MIQPNPYAKEIDGFIKEQDFYKTDTAGDIRAVYDELVRAGQADEVDYQVALDAIESIVSAIRNEYGE